VLEVVSTALRSVEEAGDVIANDETLDAAAPVGRKRCSSQVIEVVFISGFVWPNLPKLESSGSLILTKGMWWFGNGTM
jgi:hypothetical protein